MNAKVRRVVEMGGRALAFCRAHLDESAGYVAALARLEELVARVDLLADQQLTGIRTVARTMAAEAVSRKELLISHGLVETVLDDLNAAIAKFDAAVNQGTEGRRAPRRVGEREHGARADTLRACAR